MSPAWSLDEFFMLQSLAAEVKYKNVSWRSCDTIFKCKMLFFKKNVFPNIFPLKADLIAIDYWVT